MGWGRREGVHGGGVRGWVYEAKGQGEGKGDRMFVGVSRKGIYYKMPRFLGCRLIWLTPVSCQLYLNAVLYSQSEERLTEK